MKNRDLDNFNKSLLDPNSENPFRYPEPPPRPPFMVGGEKYLNWFNDTYVHTIGHGYNVSFIVGEPGAGKSHFLSHLDYLFYETDRFNGIYSIYRARHDEIDEKDLWIQLFLNDDAIKKLRRILPLTKIQASKIRSDVKDNVLKLMNRTLQIDMLDSKTLHTLAEGLSELLVEEKAGICVAIDNVDEHFRFLSNKFGREKALERFFGMIRSTTTGLKQIVLLMACTTPVYSEIKRVTVDRTFARRIEFQEETLTELTSNQCLELVHAYLKYWSHRHGVSLPLVEEEECIFKTPSGDTLSIYPFSKTAVEYFHKVTGQFGGDIVLVCCESINDMKTEKNVFIVKDETIFCALEEARKRRPQIISKMDVLETDRAKILKKLMAKKLKKIERRTREKYAAGIDMATIVSRVETFAGKLDIKTVKAPEVVNYRNYTQWIKPNEHLRIWQYKDKKIAVEYVIGESSPIGTKDRKVYSNYVEPRDFTNVASLIEADKATHGLFIRYWAGSYSRSAYRMWSELSKFDPIIKEVDLDDTLFKVVGAIEEGNDDKNDLVRHVDRFHVHLTETLERLIKQARPPEEISKEKPIRYF